MKKPFYIDHEALLKAGFTHERMFDRDGQNDPFDNMKIDIYKKSITPELVMEVCLGHFSQIQDQWEHINSTVDLVAESGTVTLKITKLDELLSVFNKLSELLDNGSENRNDCIENQNICSENLNS